MSDLADSSEEPDRDLRRARGRLRGQIRIADDFDDLPDDIAEPLGARTDAPLDESAESPNI